MAEDYRRRCTLLQRQRMILLVLVVGGEDPPPVQSPSPPKETHHAHKSRTHLENSGRETQPRFELDGDCQSNWSRISDSLYSCLARTDGPDETRSEEIGKT